MLNAQGEFPVVIALVPAVQDLGIERGRHGCHFAPERRVTDRSALAARRRADSVEARRAISDVVPECEHRQVEKLSFHARVAVFCNVRIGLRADVMLLLEAKENVPRPTRYLLRLVFNAVFPFPNTS